MLFLKRILFFAAKGPKEKRKAKRHAVGEHFPVKVFVGLVSVDERGQPLPSIDGKGQDWGGYLINISIGGVSVALARSASAKRGDPCWLKLSLDANTIEIEGKVAHFRTDNRGSTCGIELKFIDPRIQQAYGQLLESVAIGGSFAPFPKNKVKQDHPELHKEKYKGNKGSVLTIWRRGPGTPPMAFDFTMGSYSLHWDSKSGKPIIRSSDDSKSPTAGERDDIHQLTKLVLPNLSESVPADVRSFLRHFLAK